jgi:DNA-binding protein
MGELPLAPIGRIMKKAGAKRVSPEAEKHLAIILENMAREISKEAVLCANHAGRVTVKSSDIELSSK